MQPVIKYFLTIIFVSLFKKDIIIIKQEEPNVYSKKIFGLLIFVSWLSLLNHCYQNGTNKSTTLEEPNSTEFKINQTQSQNKELSSMDSKYPVIGQFRTKDKLILISTGPTCPLYTLKSSDGQVLAIDLPADKFTAKFPEVKDLIEQGIAKLGRYRLQVS